MATDTSRDTLVGVAAIAIASGGLAALASVAPTESTVIDAILVGASIAVVTAIAARAARTVVLGALVGASAASASIPLAIIGITVLAIAAFITTAEHPGAERRTPVIHAVIAGVALNLAARSTLGGFHGLSAIVAIAIACVIFASGAHNLPTRQRRGVRIGVAVLAGAAVAATGLAAYTAARSMDDFESASERTNEGMDLLRKGDLVAARAAFDDARDQFKSLHDRFTAAPMAPSAIVPVLAQHRRAVAEVTARAGASADAISHALGTIDFDDLVNGPGRVDLDAVDAILGPLSEVAGDLDALATTTKQVRSPWLAWFVDDRLDDLAGSVEHQQSSLATIREVAEAAPALLGRDRPRHYFVAFTTPAEARGLNGFMGNWALLEADNGTIRVTESGRHDRLDKALTPGQLRLNGPAEWLARYGQFGFTNGPDGTINTAMWVNHTMAPDAASTGQIAAQLFAASGGDETDGYFALDVFTLARLIDLTGPLDTSDGTRLDRDNTTEYLLNGQYRTADRGERVDMLEEVTDTMIERLLGDTLPSPTRLFRALGPMVDEGHLAGWMADPDDQALFERTGLAGGLPDPTRGDAVAVTFNNAIGNKIDYFLRARLDHQLNIDVDTGSARSTTTLQMDNRALADQPDYVVGNAIGLPRLTNRTYVSIYGTLPISSVTIDGESVAVETGLELGYFVASLYVDTVPGQPRTITVERAGTIELGTDVEIALRSPPTVRRTPMSATVTLHGAAGSTTRTLDVERGSARMPIPLTR